MRYSAGRRNMMIILSVLLTTFTLGNGMFTKPSFCHDLDCPNYTVIKTANGYEHRHYEMTQWVTKRVITTNYDRKINSEMFFSLFYYISGNNTSGMKIPMTAPVLTTYTPNANSHETVVEMHFMIPHNMQPYPPSPTDPSVYITTLPPLDVYVKSFGGFADYMTDMVKMTELKGEINDTSLYYSSHFYTAGYDGPYTLNRHNEVWLAAKSS